MESQDVIDVSEDTADRGRLEYQSTKSKSFVYDHFTLTAAKTPKYKCNHCGNEYVVPKDKSTGTLGTHLTKRHANVLKNEAEKNQKSICEYLPKRTNTETFSNDQLSEKILKYIIIQNAPFSVVESKEFRDIITYCRADASIPSKTTISNNLTREYLRVKEKMTNVLQKAPGKLSFIVDGWSSSNMFAFQGVIVTWISENWKLNNMILDMTILEGSHSGKNLATCFFDVLDDMQLLEKILGITTDNASNNDTFFTNLRRLLLEKGIDFCSENYRIRCLAHILNIACKASLAILLEKDNISGLTEEADDDVLIIELTTKDLPVILRLRKTVVLLRASPQRREAFRRQCVSAEIKVKELIQDIDIRWNSTYKMISRALKYRIPIENTLRSDPKLSKLILTDDNWLKLNTMKEFLKPFKNMTDFLSNQKFPTMSLCVMVYAELYDHIETSKKSTDELLVRAASAACGKIDKYYPSSDGLAYVISTVLDPRCKLEWAKKHFNSEVVRSYKSALQKLWDTEYKPSEQTPEPSLERVTNESKIEALLFTKHLKKSSNISERDELKVYLSEKPVESLPEGILKWWENHAGVFPNLSRMARDYLAISGSGVPVECLFSGGRDLISSRRQSMDPQTIQQAFCLKGWLKFLDSQHLDLGVAMSKKIVAL